jgi:hypothetical protein
MHRSIAQAMHKVPSNPTETTLGASLCFIHPAIVEVPSQSIGETTSAASWII